ncbi:hypothetical protein Tco_1236253 [Tanacetum coccineum]
MSSSPHSAIASSAFDMENAFSTMNIYNYTSASSGSTSFNSSEDSRDGIIPPTYSLFYNNPYLKDVQVFYAKESHIPPPDPITPPVILTPSPPSKSSLPLQFPEYYVFVSSFYFTSSTFDMENAFSTMNIYNYTSASSGSTSFNSSKDSRDDMIPPTSSLFYNNPYLKDVQAFYAKESPIPPPDPITSPVILTPSPVLPPSLLFDP